MKRNSGKFLLLALTLMAILSGVAVYRYGYLNVRTELSDIKEAQSLKMKMLRKQISLIATKAQMEEEQLSLGEERKAEGTRFIDGATAALAGATMQQLVKAVVTGKGGTVVAENVGKPEDAGGFTILNETVDTAFPDIKALIDTVSSLQTQTPYLGVREIEVRVKNSADPKDLVARLKISGISGGK